MRKYIVNMLSKILPIPNAIKTRWDIHRIEFYKLEKPYWRKFCCKFFINWRSHTGVNFVVKIDV